jgi:hypothetical protein
MHENGSERVCFVTAAKDNYQILSLKLKHGLRDAVRYIKS